MKVYSYGDEDEESEVLFTTLDDAKLAALTELNDLRKEDGEPVLTLASPNVEWRPRKPVHGSDPTSSHTYYLSVDGEPEPWYVRELPVFSSVTEYHTANRRNDPTPQPELECNGHNDGTCPKHPEIVSAELIRYYT